MPQTIYAYNADLWCEDCAQRIGVAILNDDADAFDAETVGADNVLEYGAEIFKDSGAFPIGAPAGESDAPNHCAAGADCVNALDLTAYATDTDRTLYGAESWSIGAHLDERLTDHGVSYLREMLDDDSPTPYQRALFAFWRAIYSDELN